jgi:hypothetical protein
MQATQTLEIEILVFKTNAPQQIDKMQIARLFDRRNDVLDWNFDLEDCDRIFRVVSIGINPNEVIKRMRKIGIRAIELTD